MSEQQNPEPTNAEAGAILEQIEADDAQPQKHQEASEAAEYDSAEDSTGRSKAARDAAKYRTQLRETEAERDALIQQLESLQRQVIDAHIEKHGLAPALLWRTGLETAEVLDDDGRVDPGRVREACSVVRAEFKLDTRRPDPAQAAEAEIPGDSSHLLFKGLP